MGVFPYGVGKIKGSTPKEVEMFVKSPVVFCLVNFVEAPLSNEGAAIQTIKRQEIWVKVQESDGSNQTL
jgi:hypothetical protein